MTTWEQVLSAFAIAVVSGGVAFWLGRIGSVSERICSIRRTNCMPSLKDALESMEDKLDQHIQEDKATKREIFSKIDCLAKDLNRLIGRFCDQSDHDGK